MKLRSKLIALARLVSDEADKNAPFRKSLEEIMSPKDTKNVMHKNATKPMRRRRNPAKLDPVQMIKDNVDIKENLSNLSIEELKDVVAEFGMDPSKLVMKWKDEARIIDHIVDTSRSRAAKGQAFKN